MNQFEENVNQPLVYFVVKYVVRLLYLSNLSSQYIVNVQLSVYIGHSLTTKLGALVKRLSQAADDTRGPGFDTRDSKKNSVCYMDVMINALITCLSFNRLQKSDGRT